jgi:hypothetical protein
MVTDAEGNVGNALHLLNGASKGKKATSVNRILQRARHDQNGIADA